jgi:hypothetical protein
MLSNCAELDVIATIPGFLKPPKRYLPTILLINYFARNHSFLSSSGETET